MKLKIPLLILFFCFNYSILANENNKYDNTISDYFDCNDKLECIPNKYMLRNCSLDRKIAFLKKNYKNPNSSYFTIIKYPYNDYIKDELRGCNYIKEFLMPKFCSNPEHYIGLSVDVNLKDFALTSDYFEHWLYDYPIPTDQSIFLGCITISDDIYFSSKGIFYIIILLEFMLFITAVLTTLFLCVYDIIVLECNKRKSKYLNMS